MQRIKIKNTILIILTIIVASAIPAILFNKWQEAITFFFCHWFVREQFPKQYHHVVAAVCRTITAAVMFFGISFVLPFSLSLLSAIPICYFISWIGYEKVLKDEFEIKCEEQELELYELAAELKKYKNIDIYAMNEQQLYDYCRSRGLDDVNCKIAKCIIFDRLKGQELYMTIGYSERQTKRIRTKIFKALK